MSSKRKLKVKKMEYANFQNEFFYRITYLDKLIAQIHRDYFTNEFDIKLYVDTLSHWMLAELAEILDELDPPAQHLFWSQR